MGKSIIGNLKFQRPREGGFDHNKFAEEIEEAYLTHKRVNVHTQKNTFSPSTVGYGHGNCPRYWFIAFSGAIFDDSFTAQGIANMENGTSAHSRLQKVIGEIGRPVEFEIEITSENPPIRGFADFIIDWDGEKVVGEIKTAKEEVYAIRQSKMQPSDNHLLQLLIYMKILKLAQGVFVYENKNTQELCFIPIRVNDKYIQIIDELFEWLREVRSAYEESNLPERVGTKSSTMCKNCPVKNVCWKEYGDGDVSIRKYEILK